MKILREGPAWERRHECVRCESLLLLEESDIKYTKEQKTAVDDEKYDDTYFFFTCAKCHSHNRLDASELPPYVKADLLAEAERAEGYN